MVAIILPPFLTRLMSADSYGAWALVLQLSAYVGYLDFGIQTAVGRFVAHANEMRNAEYRDRIVSTAIAALSTAAILAIGGSIGLVALFPHIFRQMPVSLVSDASVALLLVAGSLAVGLPVSVFSGVFIGLQRYEVPAAVIGGSRILGALLIVLVVKQGGSLISMGLAVAIVNLASYVLQYLMCRRATPTYRISIQLVSRHATRELFDYCLSLSVWSFAMLLVGGLDVSLVGYFQFGAVAYYAVAASLVTFLAGLQNALFSVMVPSTAVMQARGDGKALGRVMITATRYGTFLLLLTGLPLIFGARNILALWVGSSYAEPGARILQILVAANVIRLSAAPYVMTLVGTAQQRLVILTPLLEGFSNLLVSIAAGYVFGAVGVALGTFVGSLVGVSGNLFHNMRRTSGFEFRISDYVRDGLVRPVVCALPAIAFSVILGYCHWFTRLTTTLGTVATVLVTAYLIWNWGLMGSEREKLLTGRLVPQP